MAKVVIDANVIISAAFGGNPLRAVMQAMEEDKVYLSPEIEGELTGLFSKLSKKLTREQILFLTQRMLEFMEMATKVSVSTRVVLSRDARDDHYLALCKEVEADCLITGDKDLPSIPAKALKENGIASRIITPQEFVKEL